MLRASTIYMLKERKIAGFAEKLATAFTDMSTRPRKSGIFLAYTNRVSGETVRENGAFMILQRRGKVPWPFLLPYCDFD